MKDSFHYLMVVLVTWLGCLGVVALMMPITPPTPATLKLKTYDLRLEDGAKIAWQGTSIKSTGFCTEIYIGPVVDTVVCQPHLITERTLEPAPVVVVPAGPTQ